MKILITGANSYIGMSFERWLNKHEGYTVDTIDTMNGHWKTADFTKYDAVFHVAGIAHTNAKADMRDLYYKVNCDLAVEVAKHAKSNGVKQFVFMSSIILYGRQNGAITKDTQPTPDNFYGDSKLQADIKLHELEADDFKVASIRPPMIYGKNSKGNYPRLSGLAKKTPIFPNLNNHRSMLYIDNLCECIRLIIDNCDGGFFYPQNKEYVNTAELVREIAKCHNKNIHYVNVFNPIIRLLSKRINTFSKMFGDLYYEKSLSDYKSFSYCVVDFKQSIKETEI